MRMVAGCVCSEMRGSGWASALLLNVRGIKKAGIKPAFFMLRVPGLVHRFFILDPVWLNRRFTKTTFAVLFVVGVVALKPLSV